MMYMLLKTVNYVLLVLF